MKTKSTCYASINTKVSNFLSNTVHRVVYFRNRWYAIPNIWHYWLGNRKLQGMKIERNLACAGIFTDSMYNIYSSEFKLHFRVTVGF